jgi:site-specific DNA-methyltransferase (adenine-specific)
MVRTGAVLMGVRDLLRELQSRGYLLKSEGSELRCQPTKEALTPELRYRIKENKEEILRSLQEDSGLIPQGMGMTTLAEGGCLRVLHQLPPNSVDAMVTDPPYGYEFMGKDWDKAVPGVAIWKETLRVLKPGGFAFIMCSPRQDVLSQMIINLAEAGFETGFTSLYWTYATGFTKAHNIGKAVAKKLGPEKAKKLEGSYVGFQPKPAVEVILIVMKPIDKKTYTEQAMADGKGLTWMDHCRIPYGQELPVIGNRHRHDRGEGYGFKPAWSQKGGVVWTPEKQWKQDIERQAHEKGRFPANLLISDDVLDDGRNHPGGTFPKRRGKTEYFGLDQLESGYVGRLNDSGGYSRFFSLDAWAERNLPFLIVPKASKKEKEIGLSGFEDQTVGDGRKKAIDNAFQRGKTMRKNTHPTVKPIKLMAYLITMGSREGDLILDPFCGSGTTCLAAHLLKRRSIGIEKEPEYTKIAQARLRQLYLEEHLNSDKEGS